MGARNIQSVKVYPLIVKPNDEIYSFDSASIRYLLEKVEVMNRILLVWLP